MFQMLSLRPSNPTLLLAFILLVIATILLQPASGKSVPGKMMPPKCKACNYINSPKTIKMAAVCSACGEMYGWEFEHCCLCNFAFFDTCKGAVMGISGFGRDRK